MQVKVPDIGDFSDVPVIEIHVKAGDTVAAEDPLVTLESDKATMDVPAPAAGKVTEVLVAIDDTVSEGTPILELEAEEAASRARGGARSGEPRRPRRRQTPSRQRRMRPRSRAPASEEPGGGRSW